MLRIFAFGPSTGESIVIQFPDDRWGVVDCYQPKSHGRMGTLDFLRARGVNRLLFFCLTHPHADHFLGAGRLLQAFAGNIERIWRHPGFSNIDLLTRFLHASNLRGLAGDEEAARSTQDYLEFIKAVDAEMPNLPCDGVDDRYRRVMAATTLLQERDITITALAPGARTIEDVEAKVAEAKWTSDRHYLDDEEGKFINDLSVVLHITYDQAHIFLLADAQDENRHLHPSIRTCSFVKLAHHGSDNGLGASRLIRCNAEKEYNVGYAVVTGYKASALPRENMLTNYQLALGNLRCLTKPPRNAGILGLPNAVFPSADQPWHEFRVYPDGRIEEQFSGS